MHITYVPRSCTRASSACLAACAMCGHTSKWWHTLQRRPDPSRAREREDRAQSSEVHTARNRGSGPQRLSLTTRLWKARMWVDGDSLSLFSLAALLWF